MYVFSFYSKWNIELFIGGPQIYLQINANTI